MSNCNCDGLHPGNATTVTLYETGRDDLTVTVTVKDSSNNVVTGGNAVSMPLVADGEYSGILPATLAIIIGGTYSVEITANVGATQYGFWPLTIKATARR